MIQNVPTNQPMILYNQNVTLKIIPKSSVFFTNDYIEGQIELSTLIEIIISEINLTLYSSQKWAAFLNESNSNKYSEKTDAIVSSNLNVKKKLNINSNLISLKTGKYLFGFKFKIPSIINPSFEYSTKNSNINLRYILFANIISPYIKGNTSIYLFFKQKQKVEANTQLSSITERIIYKWGLFDCGKTKLTVTILNTTDNFKFDEDIKLNINIDNINGKLNATECIISLKRIIILKNAHGVIIKVIEDELINQTIKTLTNSGETKNFPYILKLKDINNTNLENIDNVLPFHNYDNLNYFLPTMKSSLIECSYSIKFSLYFNSFIRDKDIPKINMPIIICHQSLDEYKNEIQQRSNIINNIPLHNNNLIQNNMSHYHMMPSNNMKPIRNNNNEIPNTPLSKKEFNMPINNIRNNSNQINQNHINNNENILTNFEDKDYNEYMNNKIIITKNDFDDKNYNINNNKNINKTDFEDKSYINYMNDNKKTDNGNNNKIDSNNNNNNINQIQNENNEDNVPPLPLLNNDKENLKEKIIDNK